MEVETPKPNTETPDQPAVQFESVTPGFDAEFFWERNKKIIGGVIGVVMLGVAGYFLYQNWMESKNSEAVAQSFRAVSLYEQDSLDLALKDGQYSGFPTLADEYSGTKTGNLAKFYLGSIYFKKGKIAEGIEQFESFKKSNDQISASAYAALGFGYEEQKDFKQAADNYEKAASINENSQTSPFYLMNAARCYESNGDKEKALSVYKKVKDLYPLSAEGQQVEKYIARLSND